MHLPLPTKAPFSFHQTLAFVRRFPPCQGQFVVTDDSLTAAVTVGGRPTAFTIRGAGSTLHLEVERAVDAPALLARASHLVGARDDLGELYAAAEGDRPFRPVIDQLHGLHHVRFLTLEEVAVYSVMTQRTPIAMAARMKHRLFERIGLPVETRGTTLYALPAIETLATLDGQAFGEAIGHARKGDVIAGVVRGIARIGERFLCEAPYEAAKAELLAIPGIGPFSAAMILLRGLGRMDEVPLAQIFEDEARALYGDAYNEAAIRARYGKQLGYWSFYLKTSRPGLESANPVRDSTAVTRMPASKRTSP
jgi:DNA-3-methyladenine glycosylase II